MGFLYGDDKSDQPDSDGYVKKTLTGRDGIAATIRVKQQVDPYKNVKVSRIPGKYDPSSPDYSATSSLANKSFSSADSTFSKNTEALESHEQQTFSTKSYFDDSSAATPHSNLNLESKFSAPTLTTYNQSATGLDKSYPVNRAEDAQHKSAPFTDTSSDLQNRTANFGNDKTVTYASTLANKPYLGPESAVIHHEMAQVNEGLIQLKDLPNRPLTIDEVRALINHGVAPNTDAKPEPPSKALNDPDYKPEPSPATQSGEDSDEAVPSPGTMSEHPLAPPPENSEPLPNK